MRDQDPKSTPQDVTRNILIKRRLLTIGPLLAAVANRSSPSAINPRDTFVLKPEQIRFQAWQGLPPGSGQMAALYGDLNQPGPYLVMMKWSPGWFSAPHNYKTDRICVVVSGAWHVNSGQDFSPRETVPVPAGGFVLRHARTWHYDGVPRDAKEPVVIAVFGIGPVDIQLADPAQPPWRRA